MGDIKINFNISNLVFKSRRKFLSINLKEFLIKNPDFKISELSKKEWFVYKNLEIDKSIFKLKFDFNLKDKIDNKYDKLLYLLCLMSDEYLIKNAVETLEDTSMIIFSCAEMRLELSSISKEIKNIFTEMKIDKDFSFDMAYVDYLNESMN